MAKFEVTPELAYTIRSARTQKNVTAKAVAEHINRSQSYMSRLEKAEIKTIDEDILSSILMFIYSNEKSEEPSLDSILDNIYSTLQLQYSDSEIDQQLWFFNYDTVYRTIPIPRALVDNFSEEMKKLGITTSDLCHRINANEGILPEIVDYDDYPFNEWQARVENHKIVYCFIKMKVTEQDVSRILNKEVDKTNYVLALSISYYLNKIKLYGSQVVLSYSENMDLTRQAKEYLNKYGFYSIAEKNRLSKLAKNQDERDRLLSTFDRENQKLVTQIVAGIKVFSDLDIQNSNRVLSSVTRNMEWDLGFLMSLAGLRFHELEGLSHNKKTELLSKINRLIKEYKELPDQQKKIDFYDPQ